MPTRQQCKKKLANIVDPVTTGKFFFEPSGAFSYATSESAADMRIHIYDISPEENDLKGDLHYWGTKKSKMTWSSSSGMWQADIATLISETDNGFFKQGFIPGEWYGVIVHDSKTGMQSYGLAFTTDIIGNVIYIDGRDVASPIDSVLYIAQVKNAITGKKLPKLSAHAVCQYNSRGELFDPDGWGKNDVPNGYISAE